MRRIKFFIITFIVTAAIISIDQASVHLLMEGQCKYFSIHLFTVIFLSFIASMISLLFLNRYEKFEKRKMDLELRETKINQSIDAISKCQDVFGNFMNGLLLIELEVQEQGSISKLTIENLRAQMDDVSQNLSILAERYKSQ